MSKPLKEQNRWQLWLVIAVNYILFYAIVHASSIELAGLKAIFTDAASILPVGIALVVTTVINGLLSADLKAKIVFLRWHDPLPGHRAFSRYAQTDPRVDIAVLEKLRGSALPADPKEENKIWYRMYKSVEDTPSVVQVHRDFLLMRDYAGISVLILLIFGGIGLVLIGSPKVSVIYIALLAAQYLLVRQAASNYGIRMVTTVLAEKCAESSKPGQPRNRANAGKK
jgi:hypothetical protein